MTDVRTLRRGEAVALSSLTRSRRSPGELVVSVVGDGPAPDVVALLLGPDGRVRDDRDLVFFNQPSSPGGAVSVEPATGSARIRTGEVEEAVARVLVGCAGGVLESGRATSFRVDVAHPGSGLLATAVVDVPAGHRAETVLEVYRWGTGWRLRLLGEGYATGLEGLVGDHGVRVEPEHAPVEPPPAPALPTFGSASPSFAPPPPPAAWTAPQATPPQAAPPGRAPRPKRRRRVGALIGAGAAVVAVVVLGATFAGGSDQEPSQPVAATTAVAAVASASTSSVAPLPGASAAVVPVASVAQTQLASLPVKGRAPMTGYDRAQFGPAWADVDRNGCDTRIICTRPTLDPAELRKCRPRRRSSYERRE